MKPLLLCLLILLIAIPSVSAQDDAADLNAVKVYVQDNVTEMQTANETLVAYSQRYYDVLQGVEFDYQTAWANHTAELTGLLAATKEAWLTTSLHYELSEGIVAGVPSLSYYDVWLDAGPSGEDALDWQLELPNGDVLDRPGNLFHHLTEPALWGTREEFVGLAVDFDADGELEVGEVLPEANILLGSFLGLHDATEELAAAVEAWQPTLEDVFTALVIMVPTMNEYFEQWKESLYVIGSESEVVSFVAVSRLSDIQSILSGLALAYDNISVLIDAENPDLHRQIDANFDDLLAYVGDLYAQEQAGTVFLPEEADLYGTEAQDKAQLLAALIAQAATELEIELTVE